MLHFKKIENFKGKLLKNYKQFECEIFKDTCEKGN